MNLGWTYWGSLQDVLCSTLNDNGIYIFSQYGSDKYIFIWFTLFCQSIDDNFISWTKKRNVRAECGKSKLHVYSKIRKKVLSFITYFLSTILTNFLIIFINISRYSWIFDLKMHVQLEISIKTLEDSTILNEWQIPYWAYIVPDYSKWW